MAVFTYTAQRSLAPSHVAGTTYSIELKLLDAAPDREIIREDQRTMSGATERQYFGHKREWSCTTTSIPPHMQPYVREFLHSTEDGHGFLADIYGSATYPHETVQVFRTDTRQLEARSVRIGGRGGGRDDYFRYTFTIREE